MKTLLKLFLFTLATILIAISCQKLLSNQDLSATTFNTTVAKNWYYSTFIKSQEWSGSAQKNKQIPDWKNGKVTTIENQQAVVYPLIKETRSFLIPGDNSLTEPECKRVADASLSKIAFIKNNADQITVKEIDYIPDWKYLQRKHFNIGEMKDANGKSDFTGRVVTKDWAGKILSIQIQVEGKTVKVGKKVVDKKQHNSFNGNGNTSSTQGCTVIQYCLWQQDCVLIIYGDGWTENECGEWYIVECWEEEDCPPPPPGEGGGGGGGNEDPPQCDPSLVSAEEEEYNNYVLMKSSSQVNEDAEITNDGPDPITGVLNWIVAEASIANWQIKANTNYSYYHDKYYDVNLNTFIHKFNLYYYQTVSSYYVGSNTFIQSTWTQTSVQDQVFSNNTANTKGSSVVHGTIRHVLSLPLNVPYCPKALDQTIEISPNTLNFTPR